MCSHCGQPVVGQVVTRRDVEEKEEPMEDFRSFGERVRNWGRWGQTTSGAPST